MIHAITVTNFKGESLRMELSHPEKSGMIIKGVTGIGGTQADINMTDMATSDGGWFNSARVGSRNIVLSIALYPMPTIEDTRRILHRYFPIKKTCRLTFETDTRTTYIDGYVETNEVEIFSEEESVSVSIICPEPYFQNVTEYSINFGDADPLFEFSFSNESLTDDLLELGAYRLDDRIVVNYEGDIDTGFSLTLHALNTVENIEIYNAETREYFAIDTARITAITGKAYGNTDDIVIETTRGKRRCRLRRGGVYTNIIGAVKRDSTWLQLTPGGNIFVYTASKGDKDLVINFNYRNAYGGV